MEVYAPAYKTPNEVPVETDVLQMDYPKQQYAVGALFMYLLFLCMGIALLALAYKSWETGMDVPAVFLVIVGGANTVVFAGRVINHVAAWIRGVRGAWWLRLSTTGFAVNKRLLGVPHRYKWCEIESFAPAGHAGTKDRVGFRYSPECHRFRPRRRSKPDGYVVGHWDRPAEEAVELMVEWLTRYRAA